MVFTSQSNENKSVSILKAGASGFITKNLRKNEILNDMDAKILNELNDRQHE